MSFIWIYLASILQTLNNVIYPAMLKNTVGFQFVSYFEFYFMETLLRNWKCLVS